MPVLAAGDHPNRLLLAITISGPSHVHIVLRESEPGQLITRWFLDEEALSPSPSNSVSLSLAGSLSVSGSHPKYTSVPHGQIPTISPSLLREVQSRLIAPSPLRSEGLRVMEVGFGLCAAHRERCQKRIWVEVEKNNNVNAKMDKGKGKGKGQQGSLEVITYGHYVDQTDDALLQSFVDLLPIWAKGAEWTKFPSILISETISL
jgi:hypothetical protein